MKKIIPKKIHFAGFDYYIEFVEHLDSGDSWARTSVNQGKIFIEKGMTLQKQYESLIHELLHISWRHTFSNFKLEEERIKAWSMNIYGILKDNNFLK